VRRFVPRDARVHLDDILEACKRVSTYTLGLSFEQFRGDQKSVDAVVRNLEVIGEAAKKVPDEVRKEIGIEWKRIAGLKDILIHEYFRIDLEIIWDVVQTKVPDLSRRVGEYLQKKGP
jgi:uncharacterized protein with HEPN domain